MASSTEYFNYILDQLSQVSGITYRKMMGEYILYMDGRIAAYICDDRLLVKSVPSALKLLPNAVLEPPYDGAKEMILVDRVDDRVFLKRLFEAMLEELPQPKKRMKNLKEESK